MATINELVRPLLRFCGCFLFFHTLWWVAANLHHEYCVKSLGYFGSMIYSYNPACSWALTIAEFSNQKIMFAIPAAVGAIAYAGPAKMLAGE